MSRRRWQPRPSTLLLPVFLPLVPLLSVVAQETPDSAGVSVVGQVVNRRTGLPLENAVIRVPQLGIHVLSDSLGQFHLRDVNPGVYRLGINCLGYEWEAGEFTIIRPGSFRIALNPIELGPDAKPGRIMGRVSSLEAGEPIADAEVSLLDMGISRVANHRGWFEFPEIPPGIHVVRTSFLDRETREDSVFLGENQVLELNVQLAREPIPLEGITVTAHPRWLVASGFFRRRGRNYEGRQWTRGELEELDPMFVGDVITTIPGVRSMGMNGLYGRRNCRLTVFVDDVRMDETFHLDLLEPRNIEALEAYHGAGKPGEFFWYCGVVLVWLKH